MILFVDEVDAMIKRWVKQREKTLEMVPSVEFTARNLFGLAGFLGGCCYGGKVVRRSNFISRTEPLHDPSRDSRCLDDSFCKGFSTTSKELS